MRGGTKLWDPGSQDPNFVQLCVHDVIVQLVLPVDGKMCLFLLVILWGNSIKNSTLVCSCSACTYKAVNRHQLIFLEILCLSEHVKNEEFATVLIMLIFMHIVYIWQTQLIHGFSTNSQTWNLSQTLHGQKFSIKTLPQNCFWFLSILVNITACPEYLLNPYVTLISS